MKNKSHGQGTIDVNLSTINLCKKKISDPDKTILTAIKQNRQPENQNKIPIPLLPLSFLPIANSKRLTALNNDVYIINFYRMNI